MSSTSPQPFITLAWWVIMIVVGLTMSTGSNATGSPPQRALDVSTFDGHGTPLDVDVARPPERIEGVQTHSLAQIEQLEWEPGYPGLRTLSLDGKARWVRTRLNNPSPVTQKIWLQVSKPYTDDIDCMLHHSDGTWSRVQLGDHRPFATRLIDVNDFLIPIELAGRSSLNMACLIDNDGSVVADLKAWKPRAYMLAHGDEVFFRAILFGALIFALLGAACFAVVERSWWPVLMVADVLPVLAGINGLSGDGFHHLWPSNPEFNTPPYYWILIGLSTQCAVLAFLLQLSRKELGWMVALAAVPLALAGISLVTSSHRDLILPAILWLSLACGVILLTWSLKHLDEGAVAKVVAIGLGTQVLGLFVNAFGLLEFSWLVPSHWQFQNASLLAGVIKSASMVVALAMKAKLHQTERDNLHLAYTEELSEKLNYELQYSSMLLRDAQHNLPNQRAFELAIQNMQPTDGWPITVWIVRLNRMTQLQTAMSADSVSVAFRDGVKRFADWLDSRADVRLITVLENDKVASISDHMIAFCTERAASAKLLREVESFLVARQPWEGLYLAWDPHIGLAITHEEDARKDPLGHARIALGRCSSHHRAQLYNPEDKKRESLLEGLSMDMDGAIERGELELHYQPKVTLDTCQTRSLEALVRWRHPQRGLIPPGLFIAEAEATGAIHKITLWAIKEALRFANALEDDLVRIAVNISAFDLATPTFEDEVRELFGGNEALAQRLIFEVTESVAMADAQNSACMLGRFRDMGILISMDDFGTGQSSLGMLEALPIDEVKIDRSLIVGSENNSRKCMVLKSVIELGRRLGLTVTAEGVETNYLVNWLQAAGCHVVQGYYFSKPLPAQEALAWMIGSSAQLIPSRPTNFNIQGIDDAKQDCVNCG